MKDLVDKSKKGYSLLWKYRKHIIFDNKKIRGLYKFFWILGITKLHFVFFVDYQMVLQMLLSIFS